jgi:hypothetical protein
MHSYRHALVVDVLLVNPRSNISILIVIKRHQIENFGNALSGLFFDDCGAWPAPDFRIAEISMMQG